METKYEYKKINRKPQAQVTYLGCALDESMSVEPMALKVIDKVNKKLKFLYRKGKTHCNAVIQPHFDYAYLAWYQDTNYAK